MVTLGGLSGVSDINDAVTPLRANPQRFSCAAGLKLSRLGRQNVSVYALDLGSDTTLGGTLTLSTGGQSRSDTVLYVGLGCPDSNAAFGCVAANDDSKFLKSKQSRVAIAAAQRVYYIIVGGWSGDAVRSGLQWDYLPPRTAAGPGSVSSQYLASLIVPATW